MLLVATLKKIINQSGKAMQTNVEELGALEDNVVNWVLEKVTVEDKAMTLDELMGRS